MMMSRVKGNSTARMADTATVALDTSCLPATGVSPPHAWDVGSTVVACVVLVGALGSTVVACVVLIGTICSTVVACVVLVGTICSTVVACVVLVGTICSTEGACVVLVGATHGM